MNNIYILFWNLGSEVLPKTSSSSSEEKNISEIGNENVTLNFHNKVDENFHCHGGESSESKGPGSLLNTGTGGKRYL